MTIKFHPIHTQTYFCKKEDKNGKNIWQYCKIQMIKKNDNIKSISILLKYSFFWLPSWAQPWLGVPKVWPCVKLSKA